MMRQLKIKEIGEVVSGSTPKTDKKEYWDGEIPWVTPKELGQLEGKYLNNTERKITASGFKSCSTRLIPPGNILFTSRAPIGHLAINKIEVCTNQGFKSIILKEDFSADYIYFALKKNVAKLQDLGTGSTFKELSKAKFEEFVLSVPSLPDQRHIAQLLSQAEQLIAQRHESLRLLDAYVKSTFLEMFGDPVRNEKGWNIGKFKDLAILDRKQVLPSDFTKEDFYIGLEDIEKETGNIIKISSENAEDLKSSKFRFTSNHILYAKLRPYLNKVALPYQSGICSTDIFPVLPLEGKSNKFFICYLMRSKPFVTEMHSKSSGANLPRASASVIENFKTYQPPIGLQTQFAQIVAQTELLKTQYQQSLAELEQLYGILSQKAFRGELTYALEMSGK